MFKHPQIAVQSACVSPQKPLACVTVGVAGGQSGLYVREGDGVPHRRIYFYRLASVITSFLLRLGPLRFLGFRKSSHHQIVTGCASYITRVIYHAHYTLFYEIHYTILYPVLGIDRKPSIWNVVISSATSCLYTCLAVHRGHGCSLRLRRHAGRATSTSHACGR